MGHGSLPVDSPVVTSTIPPQYWRVGFVRGSIGQPRVPGNAFTPRASMQRPDEKKRAQIVATAARLFATRPYHKVRLEDIATDARIGKGTLYIYFDNKEDLYFS